MSPEPADNNFDPAAVVAAMVGTWSYRHGVDVTNLGWLHFTEGGRAIMFPVAPLHPDNRGYAFWYTVESPTHLRFRPKHDRPGWLQGYRFDGSALTLSDEKNV